MGQEWLERQTRCTGDSLLGTQGQIVNGANRECVWKAKRDTMFSRCVVRSGVKTTASFVKALPNSHALTVEGVVSPVALTYCHLYFSLPLPVKSFAARSLLLPGACASCRGCCLLRCCRPVPAGWTVLLLMTSRECKNSAFRSPFTAAFVCRAWRQSLGQGSSTFGSDGSRFSALMRSISAIIGVVMGELRVERLAGGS